MGKPVCAQTLITRDKSTGISTLYSEDKKGNIKSNKVNLKTIIK